jgi:hypothetical protein
MPDSLPRTFSGWEVEALDRESDLDRSNEANGKFQGKYIQWDLTNDDDKRSLFGNGWTVFSGEDSTGRLVFSGVSRIVSCQRRIKLPFGGRSFVRSSHVFNSQSKLSGLIELQPDEFGPSINYKVGLSIRAKVIPGRWHYDNVDCDVSLRESFTPCVISIKTNTTNTELGFAADREIKGLYDNEFDISLDLITDTIDFNSLYPGQAVQIRFTLLGKQMTLEKVTLSKLEF